MLELTATLEGHLDRVWHVSWSKDGKHLASCGEDKVIRIWTFDNNHTPPSWICICTLEEGTQTRTIRSCEWSPDNTKIASVSFCGIVAIWESQSNSKKVWDQVASLEGHENEVKCVSWNYDGRYLASCGRDKKIWLWEDMEGPDLECVCILEGHTQDVKFVKWHPKENVLFSASYDDTLRIWTEDDGDWYCVETLLGHTSTVWGISLNKAGNCMVTCSDDLSIIIWKVYNESNSNNSSYKSSWKSSFIMTNTHKQPIYSIDWSENHGYIASGGGDNKIFLYMQQDKRGDMKAIKEYTAHDGDVNCVRWNNGSSALCNYLATAGDDGLVKIWTLMSASPPAESMDET